MGEVKGFFDPGLGRVKAERDSFFEHRVTRSKDRYGCMREEGIVELLDRRAPAEAWAVMLRESLHGSLPAPRGCSCSDARGCGCC